MHDGWQPRDPAAPIHVQRGYTGYWGWHRMEADYSRAERRRVREGRVGERDAVSRIMALEGKERVRCSTGCGCYVWAEPGVETRCDRCELEGEAR